VRKAAYYWQYSQDQQTWTSLSETMKANNVISGLTAVERHLSIELMPCRSRTVARGVGKGSLLSGPYLWASDPTRRTSEGLMERSDDPATNDL
jgi:hypothetical protein